MGAYILRRLLLFIPTMIGIMAISFLVVQFAPGGPIERIIAQIQGTDVSATSRIGGGGGDFQGVSDPGSGGGEINSRYRGAQGLDPEFIRSLEKQFGFDKPAIERFGLMLWNYLRFDFGESYFRDISVIDLIIEKMPVSISLGLWMTLLSYLISIPLGIRKAMRDGSSFDVWTSGVIIVAYAIPGFLFAILLDHPLCRRKLLRLVPASRAMVGPVCDDAVLAVGHRSPRDRRLFLAPRAAAHRDGAVGLRHDDAPHQELVPRRDPQAVRDDGAGEGPDRTRRCSTATSSATRC